VVLGRLESCEGLLGGTGPRPKALEKGVVLGNGQDGRTTACSGVREPAVLRPLKAGAAGAVVWAGCLGVRVDLGRRAWQEDRRRTAAQYGAVRRSKDGLRSKDGRREGDRGPDLEAVADEPHARRGVRDCRSMARGADLAGRVPGAPAALWSAATLVFSRSTRL
jgi:hypothetical protein